MASVEKFTLAAVVNEIRHNNRTIKNSSNPDIDRNKINLNYSLTPDRHISEYDYFKQRKSELYCYNRPDVKVLAGWVVTAPKDLSEADYDMFFQTSFQFLSNRYGIENVIQATVHNDESGQPHLHFLFIPVAPDKKHGGEKICANDVLNKKELRNFHPDLQRHLKNDGIDAKVMTGITKAQGGNKTVDELKAERSRNIQHSVERGRW